MIKEILRIMHAAGFAFEGLAYLIREEKNTRLLLAIAVLTIIICPLLGFSVLQTAVVFFAVAVTVVAEVINTSVEITLDLECKGKYNSKVKIAKDVASCAVLLCVINSVTVFLIFLFSNLLK